MGLAGGDDCGFCGPVWAEGRKPQGEAGAGGRGVSACRYADAERLCVPVGRRLRADGVLRDADDRGTAEKARFVRVSGQHQRVASARYHDYEGVAELFGLGAV